MTVSFPQLVPSTRAFGSGDWPVKSFTSQDGMEVRYLYGSKRRGRTLELGYNAIPDTKAEEFIDHYESVKGTFETFILSLPGSGDPGAKRGWHGEGYSIGPSGALEAGSAYRYAGPVQVTSVRPGVSNVQVSLVAVLVP